MYLEQDENRLMLMRPNGPYAVPTLQELFFWVPLILAIQYFVLKAHLKERREAKLRKEHPELFPPPKPARFKSRFRVKHRQ